MLVTAQSLAMLKNSFCRCPIIHPRQEPAPRAGHRLDDHRVAQRLQPLQAGVRGESQAHFRLWNFGLRQGEGCVQLIGTCGSRCIAVQGAHTPGVQNMQGVEAARCAHTAAQHQVVGQPLRIGLQRRTRERTIAMRILLAPVLFNLRRQRKFQGVD